MAANRKPEHIDEALRDRIVRAARRHASEPDAEDRAQEVMIRLVQEVASPTAPILERRALAKLKDVEVETFRKAARNDALLQKASNAEATKVGAAASQDAYRIIEMFDQIKGIVGEDAAAFALLKTFFRATEEDAARCLGWSAQRAAAARMRLYRNKAQITRFLTTPQEEE